MPVKELRELYGNTTNTRSLMNKAICNECVGASELLDAMRFVAPKRNHSPNWAKTYELLEKIRLAMTTDVAKRHHFRTERKEGGTVADGV